MTTDLIRGITALSFKDDLTKDSERLRILVSMTIWAIWKSRNKNTMQDQVVMPNETRETLKELIRDIIRKSWNSTQLMEGRERLTRQCAIKALWAEGRFADLTRKRVQPLISLRRDVAGHHRRGRVLVGKVGLAECPTGRLTHQQAVPESHTRRVSAKVHDAFPPVPHPKNK